MKLAKLLIDRKWWVRGPGDDSYLRSPTTKRMCCLGFLGRACGYKAASITDIGFPSQVVNTTQWTKGVINRKGNDTYWTQRAVSINDNERFSDQVRESKLKKHFKKIGIRLSFK